MKNFLSGKICLILVIIQKIQSFLMRLIKSYGQNERWIWWRYCNWICGIKVKNVFYKKLMVKSGIQQEKWVSQLSLINSKMLYLMKKLLDTKWKQFKIKSGSVKIAPLKNCPQKISPQKITTYGNCPLWKYPLMKVPSSENSALWKSPPWKLSPEN